MVVQRKHEPKIRNRTPEQRQLANLRERRRMTSIYHAFETLRECLPIEDSNPQKITRVQLLQLALEYINELKKMLETTKFTN